MTPTSYPVQPSRSNTELTPGGKRAGWTPAGCCSQTHAAHPLIGWSHGLQKTGQWVAAPALWGQKGRFLSTIINMDIQINYVQGILTQDTHAKTHLLSHELSDIIGKQGRVVLFLIWRSVNRQILWRGENVNKIPLCRQENAQNCSLINLCTHTLYHNHLIGWACKTPHLYFHWIMKLAQSEP